jgi:hypothetical protein
MDLLLFIICGYLVLIGWENNMMLKKILKHLNLKIEKEDKWWT